VEQYIHAIWIVYTFALIYISMVNALFYVVVITVVNNNGCGRCCRYFIVVVADDVADVVVVVVVVYKKLCPKNHASLGCRRLYRFYFG